jgi:hypothetical protein
MGETANAETQYVFLFLFLCCMCFGENYQCPLTATGIWFDNIVLFWKRILTLFMNDQMVGSKLEFVFFYVLFFVTECRGHFICFIGSLFRTQGIL